MATAAVNKQIIAHIEALGVEKASEFYGQSKMLLRAWVNPKNPKKPNAAAIKLFQVTQTPSLAQESEILPPAVDAPPLVSSDPEALVRQLKKPVHTAEDDLDRPLVKRTSGFRKEEVPAGTKLPAPTPTTLAATIPVVPRRHPAALPPEEVLQELPPAKIAVANGAREEVQAQPENGTPIPKKVLALCFPCYRTTNPLTHFAIVKLFDKAKMHHILAFNTQLVEARNELAHRFLHETEAEWSFWLDDDVVPPIGDARWWKYNTQAPANFPDNYANLHVINRLHSSGQKFISGLYFGRNPLGKAMYAEGLLDPEENSRAHNVPRNEIKASRGVAAGCMLVHRSVFIDIMASQPIEYEPTVRHPYPFFNKTDTEGEDMAFSKRAIAAGHQPYVDFGCIAAHLGHALYGPWNTK